MNLPIYQVDAFTNERFKGNPAAVCPLTEWLEEQTMQKIAAENNLSETAFYVKNDDTYEIRWFTPAGEVDLCGHATLATAFVLFTFYETDLSMVTFHSKSGPLHVTKEDERLTLTFPSRVGERCVAPEALIKGLGKAPKEVYAARDYMAVFDSEDDINQLQLDMNELKKLDQFAVIVTAKGNDVDFVSRFFAPKAGVDEDPVTGSAHCTLIPYWCKTLKKDTLVAKQISTRGGTLYCENLGDVVKISGEAVLYLKGEITF